MKKPVASVNYVDLCGTEELRGFFEIIGVLFNIQLGLAPLDLRRVWPTARPRQEDNPVCRVIQATPDGVAACAACDKKHCAEALRAHHGICYLCHAGLLDYIVPVAVGGQIVGVLIGGQVLPEAPSEEGFRCLRENLKGIPVDQSKLRAAYFSMPFLPKEKAEATLKLIALFTEMLREKGIRLKPRNRKDPPSFLKAGLDYMGRHFKEGGLSLADVAKQAGVSGSHFGWSFKKHLGTVFNHHLLDLRLAEAEKLLSQTDKKIAEIALLSGFGSVSHFNRVFKVRFRRSPRQHRSRQR